MGTGVGSGLILVSLSSVMGAASEESATLFLNSLFGTEEETSGNNSLRGLGLMAGRMAMVLSNYHQVGKYTVYVIRGK